MSNAPQPFRFDAVHHAYINITTGVEYPHITGMLAATGWIDDRFYTEESSERGTAVHRLTADYDLQALDLASCTSKFRGFLLSHVAVMKIMRPVIHYVEEPLVHLRLGFGGRPDRLVQVNNLYGIWEIKSGVPEPAHRVQTALQAILAGEEWKIRPELVARFCCYLKDNGKFKLDEHTNKRDFVDARSVIRECC